VRLALRYGALVTTSIPGLTHLFPRPEDLAEADIEAAHIGKEPASTIRALARAVAKRDLTFEASINLQEAIARVRVAPGISRQMAEYVAMRAFGEPDAFPISKAHAGRITEGWRPWRAYAAMYLYSAGLTGGSADHQLRV
jgi:AraC family transcriptional regulator of adaptative response / DNA-3-methyladenine glycosylase II